MTETTKYDELQSVETKLDREIANLRRHTTINLIIGAALMVIIFGYFFFMSRKVSKLIEPEEIAAMASQRMVGYLPNVRATLDETARKEVPVLVDELISRLVKESIPEARAHLRTLALSTVDKAMDDAEAMLFEQVDQHLKAHGPEFKSLAADLATSEGTQAFEDALYKVLEDVAQDPSVKIDLLGYGVALQELDGTLEYLSQDSIALAPEEESARELISIFRELLNRERKNPSSPKI